MAIKNVILSPHYDDAVLSLGGLLVREGEQSIVVSVFTGAPVTPLIRPWDLMSGFKNSTEAITKRHAENEAALAFLGIPKENIINLAFLDQQYRHFIPLWQSDDVLLPELLAAVRAVLLQHPDARILGPSIKQDIDHQLVKKILVTLEQDSEFEHHNFFFYRDLPYATVASRADLKAEDQIIELSESDMQRKLAGVGLYTSQIAPLGSDLLDRVQTFGRKQAKALELQSPYCEVVFRVS